AQIYTRPRTGQPAEAFDVFEIRRPTTHPSHEDAAAQVLQVVQRDLGDLMSGAVDAETLMARMPRTPQWAERRVPDVATSVSVDNEASRQFTVVDMFTRDRLGLLHVIANTLRAEGLSIALSKVSTGGARAIDVFYVQRAGGGK